MREPGIAAATPAARFEHRQIREVIAQLRADHDRLDLHGVAGDKSATIGSDLVRLEALIRAHLKREERFLFPLLEEDRRPVPPRATPSANRAP